MVVMAATIPQGPSTNAFTTPTIRTSWSSIIILKRLFYSWSSFRLFLAPSCLYPASTCAVAPGSSTWLTMATWDLGVVGNTSRELATSPNGIHLEERNLCLAMTMKQGKKAMKMSRKRGPIEIRNSETKKLNRLSIVFVSSDTFLPHYSTFYKVAMNPSHFKDS